MSSNHGNPDDRNTDNRNHSAVVLREEENSWRNRLWPRRAEGEVFLRVGGFNWIIRMDYNCYGFAD